MSFDRIATFSADRLAELVFQLARLHGIPEARARKQLVEALPKLRRLSLQPFQPIVVELFDGQVLTAMYELRRPTDKAATGNEYQTIGDIVTSIKGQVRLAPATFVRVSVRRECSPRTSGC